MWKRSGGGTAIRPAPPSRSARSPRVVWTGVRGGVQAPRPAQRAGSGLGPRPPPRGQSSLWEHRAAFPGPWLSPGRPAPRAPRLPPAPIRARARGCGGDGDSVVRPSPGSREWARRGECLRGAGAGGLCLRPVLAAGPPRRAVWRPFPRRAPPPQPSPQYWAGLRAGSTRSPGPEAGGGHWNPTPPRSLASLSLRPRGLGHGATFLHAGRRWRRLGWGS